MNKLLTRIAKGLLGLSMAVGVGVALAAGNSKAQPASADSLSFSHTQVEGMATSATANTAGTYGGFTITVSNGLNASESIRVYKNETITISSTVGNMTSVEFTCTVDGNAKYGPGCLSGTGYTAGTAKVGTWSGNAASFSLTASSNQCRVASFKITYTASATPTIGLSTTNIWLIDEGSSKDVTVTASNFSSTPTISVEGTPSYVNWSANNLTLSLSPKAVGSETITVKAVNGSQSATKTLDVIVYEKHGLLADDPYSVADAVAAIDGNKATKSVYVSGIISQIDTPSSFSGQICYYISDDGTTDNQFEIYWGRNIGNVNFSSVDDIELGATVVNYGNIKKYNSTYEFDSGSYLISYTAPVATLSSIALSGEYPTSFEQNESFSYEGLVVTATYSNGSTKPVSPTSISSPVMSTIGEQTITVSYTEGEVTKTAEYTITITAPTKKWTVSFSAGDGSGNMDDVLVSDGSSYSLPECTFTAPEGKVFDHWEVGGVETTALESVTADVEVVATWKDAPSEVTDVLNNGNTINGNSSSYVDWETSALSSGAIYSGQSAGSNSSIQLRSKNSNSGIVSTTSGGVLKSVTVTFNSNTTAGRTISVYGSTSAYTAPTDLYGDDAGTLLGEANVNDGATQTINVTGNYEYVGIRAKADAMYIDSISIVWLSSATPQPVKTLTSIDVSGAKTDFTVGDEFVTTGLTVTAHYSDAEDETVTGYTVDSKNVDTTTAGTYEVVVSYTVGEITKTDSYNVTYSDPAPVEVATYKKVKTDLADFSGDYLIVYEGDADHHAKAFNGSLTTLDATYNGVDVDISSETISLSEEYEFTISKDNEGKYAIKSASGIYISQDLYTNAIDESEVATYTNTISYETVDSAMVITAEGGCVLTYNAASNQLRFRFMKAFQQQISLYKKVDKAEALALDLLNLTSEACGADGEHTKANFESAWTSLETSYTALTTEERSELAGFTANAKGTMTAEAMARYELLVNKYGLDEFITGHTFSSARTAMFFNTSESNSSMAIIIVVSLVSISSLGILLVIKKRRVTQ